MTTLWQALEQESPLQIVGTINPYCARMASNAGFKAIYLSGAGVANASHGLPDLGMTNLNDVLEDARRITAGCDLPLLVDIDTGWGSLFNIARAIKSLNHAGAAGVHIEDQVQAKRCGHRPNKAIVSTQEMCDRIKAAVDAKINQSFVIMARTDALQTEGLLKTIERIECYINHGADMIFFEGVSALADYQALTRACRVPVLANITEFGVTPLFTKQQLETVGIKLILYPLSAFRAMNKAAKAVYDCIKSTGSQQKMLSSMQTREELYEVLDYHSFEKKLDQLFMKENNNGK